MPITLVATPGAVNANSFATVDEYRAYWTAHLYNTLQLAADDEGVKAALITVGKGLNDLLQWTGGATDDVQAMTWPRKGMTTRNGFAIPQDTIPQELKNSQCEWAGQYVASDLFQTNAALQQGIASVRAGPVSVTYKDTSAGNLQLLNAELRRQFPELAYVSAEMPDVVRNLLVPSWYVRSLLGPTAMVDVFR